ncbi:AAA family ATPase [Photobacterium damselae]|uniref:AAA family ATPase n=1 Tax=Photobacterium damselae TaxID=38293 RepID=UPI001F230133|nr:AAA family ATPase [Photobacterium damselae]UKA28045.1 AAA family ATPase [Photobacterium damselae subsp. damselae]
MIKLKKVKIYGFKSSNRNIEVNFSHEPTSIIYGDNGSGKTTFLKILNAIFTHNESILISEEVNKVEIEYFDGEGYSKEISIIRCEDVFSASTESRIYKENDLFLESSYIWNDYNNSEFARSKSLFLGVDRGSQSQRVNVNSKILMNFLSKNYRMREMFRHSQEMHEFCAELAYYLRHRVNNTNVGFKTIDFDADHVFLKEINMENVEGTLLNRYRQARRNAARQVQTALFDTLAVAISEGQIKEENDEEFSTLSDLIFRNRDLIIEALDDNLENSFKDTIVEKLKKVKQQGDIETLKENPLLMKLLVKMSRQLKDSEEELSAVNTVIDRFNKFTSDNKELDFTKNQIMVKVKGGEHSISELSSGERHILTLFTLLLDQGRQRDFIIIDEPEISLNSKWQEALLPTLTELLPNCQIIVASHSPIIVQSLESLAELEVCN